jgi:hypothetical protein
VYLEIEKVIGRASDKYAGTELNTVPRYVI